MQEMQRRRSEGEGGSEGHLLLRLRAVRVAEADGVDACSTVCAWVGTRA